MDPVAQIVVVALSAAALGLGTVLGMAGLEIVNEFLISFRYRFEHAKVVYMLMGNTVPCRAFRGISF